MFSLMMFNGDFPFANRYSQILFNGDHPILGFLYVYPSEVMRFHTPKKTTIVILSYMVFNVKVVVSNSHGNMMGSKNVCRCLKPDLCRSERF